MKGDPGQRILSALRRQPGLGVRALHRATRLASATVVKHVRILAAAGRIESVRSPTGKVWTIPGRTPAPNRPHPVDMRIVDFVRKHPHCTQNEIIAAFSDVPRSTIQYRLAKLQALN